MMILLPEIVIPKHYCAPKQFKMEKCRAYYRKNHKLDRDIIIDDNHVLLDGYCAYLVLMENGVKEADVVISDVSKYQDHCTTYVYGKHEGNDKVYVWRVTPRTKCVEVLKPGIEALVRSSYGLMKVVRVVDVKSSNIPPVSGRIKEVIRCLKD